MAVAFDANSSASVTANAVTSITSSNLTVGSGSNRALLVQALWSNTNTGISMNWDNLGTPQALAQVPNAAAQNTTKAQIWGLVAPTSGAKQLSVAWTTSRDVVINQLSYTGVNQTGGATSFPNGAGNTGNNSTITVTITSVVGNAVVAALATTSGVINSVNQTQTFINGTPTNMSCAGNRAVGAASVTLTAAKGTSSIWTSAGCDIAAANDPVAKVMNVEQAINRAANY